MRGSDLTSDDMLGRAAVGMKIRRPVIALDHGHRTAWPEHPPESQQGLYRRRYVLEDEAHEHVVERLRGERQAEDLRLLDVHVGESGRAQVGEVAA
jgi:hypothetical protein